MKTDPNGFVNHSYTKYIYIYKCIQNIILKKYMVAMFYFWNNYYVIIYKFDDLRPHLLEISIFIHDLTTYKLDEEKQLIFFDIL